MMHQYSISSSLILIIKFLPLCHVGNSTESDMSIAPRLIFACPLSLMANCGLVIEALPQYTNHWSCFFLAMVGLVVLLVYRA